MNNYTPIHRKGNSSEDLNVKVAPFAAPAGVPLSLTCEWTRFGELCGGEGGEGGAHVQSDVLPTRGAR